MEESVSAWKGEEVCMEGSGSECKRAWKGVEEIVSVHMEGKGRESEYAWKGVEEEKGIWKKESSSSIKLLFHLRRYAIKWSSQLAKY